MAKQKSTKSSVRSNRITTGEFRRLLGHFQADSSRQMGKSAKTADERKAALVQGAKAAKSMISGTIIKNRARR